MIALCVSVVIWYSPLGVDDARYDSLSGRRRLGCERLSGSWEKVASAEILSR